ncbi:hypothetical protein GCM10025864_24950 [Luteimicrobium album]|uniref:Uncharacterized protein n=1 Tax=Luteimicrobium album TaxID=1054550 RepID=A0ABQ6I394_9MICO|nr:hypothetical protein GCM10025864_24950 [Luteimicrobium album]
MVKDVKESARPPGPKDDSPNHLAAPAREPDHGRRERWAQEAADPSAVVSDFASDSAQRFVTTRTGHCAWCSTA